MTVKFNNSCVTEKNSLKTCLSKTNFVTRMMGRCDTIKEQYEQCMQKEIDKIRRDNLEMSKERNRKWKESKKKWGIE
jgi:hypothetical protein